MLLANLGGLTFDRQKNHKNSLLALSGYIFFFTYFSERPAPLEPSSFAICVNWIPRKIKKRETQLSTLKHQHSL